ncbi:UNVERIFIED_ORG: hypothetical protein BTE55_16415 [Rhizobium sophorae]
MSFPLGPGDVSDRRRRTSRCIADEREVSVEILNYKKNGEQFWNRLHLSPIHGDDGRMLYFSDRKST